MKPSSTSPLDYFATIEDPRMDRRKRHKLQDIIVITLCAVLCGADNWVAIELFGKCKEAWFRSFLELENGIPSHDTFGSVFSVINFDQFQACFTRWIDALTNSSNGDIIAIDGKALRRSFDKASNKAAIHMVSAWSHENNMVLGQLKIDEKSNEITAVPKLLEMLVLKGSIVTVDALNTQKSIAKAIKTNEAEYVMALKGNHATLYDDVSTYLEDSKTEFECHETIEKDHGRIETRCYKLTTKIDWLDNKDQWNGLVAIGSVTSSREMNNKTSTETRYYLTSVKRIETFARAVRLHWGVENKLHWVLDVGFSEDNSRVRMGNASENLSLIRRTALNLLKNDTSVKAGIANKRLKAGWDEAFLIKLLGI